MPNFTGDSVDKAIFLHKVLLTNTQVSKFHKAFLNGSTANRKFLKTKLSKMAQLGQFLGERLGPLMKTVLIPFAKSVLVLFR